MITWVDCNTTHNITTVRAKRVKRQYSKKIVLKMVTASNLFYLTCVGKYNNVLMLPCIKTILFF